jgi:hypothetical protein
MDWTKILKANTIDEAAKKVVLSASMLDNLEFSAKGLNRNTKAGFVHGKLEGRIQDFKDDFASLLLAVAESHKKSANLDNDKYMLGVAKELEDLANKIKE